jgi:hypothetical protein
MTAALEQSRGNEQIAAGAAECSQVLPVHTARSSMSSNSSSALPTSFSAEQATAMREAGEQELERCEELHSNDLRKKLDSM